MTVASDIVQTWPDAVVDIGPIELPPATGEWSGPSRTTATCLAVTRPRPDGG